MHGSGEPGSDQGGAQQSFAPSLKQAFATWGEYGEAAEDLVHLTHEGLSAIVNEPQMLRLLEMEPEEIDRAEWKAFRARREVEAGFPTLHAHSLLGLCGALECLVEDVFVSRIRENRSLLTGGAFAKVKLPVALIVGLDGNDVALAVLNEVTRLTNVGFAVGPAKYERLLEFVGLAGSIPGPIRDALWLGQQVRNVWAHRGGIADRRFIESVPGSRWPLGERVNMETDDFMRLLHGIHMYGVVVLNRCLDAHGQARVVAECRGYEGILAEVPA